GVNRNSGRPYKVPVLRSPATKGIQPVSRRPKYLYTMIERVGNVYAIVFVYGHVPRHIEKSVGRAFSAEGTQEDAGLGEDRDSRGTIVDHVHLIGSIDGHAGRQVELSGFCSFAANPSQPCSSLRLQHLQATVVRISQVKQPG